MTCAAARWNRRVDKDASEAGVAFPGERGVVAMHRRPDGMITVIAAVATAALLSGCVHGTRQAAVPADAQRVAARSSACAHFSGEFNGDRSERDREINAAMTELRCDTIDRDVSVIRDKYPGNQAVHAALDAASQP